MKETKFRTLKNPDIGKQREARVIQRARKIGSVIVVSIMIAMSFAVCFSMSAEALEFVEPMTMPWTTAFEPTDSAWDSTGNHCVIIGNDTSGIQSSAWYYNAASNTTYPILEGTDPTVPAANIVVNTNTSIKYSTIQSAIDAASSGNILDVWFGTYNENIVIDIPLTIRGNGSANTLIDGGGSGTVVSIKANGVVMKGFTVTGGTTVGIHLYTVQNCRIENNTVEVNGDGILIDGSSNNIVKGNDINNNGFGMRVKNSDATKSIIGPVEYGGQYSGVLFNAASPGPDYEIFHDFKPGCLDGFNPHYTKFVTDGSYLYGMTYGGGAYSHGTIFRTDMVDGTSYSALHDFKSSEGKNPYGELTIDGSTLYGMTSEGGTNNLGTVFRINTDGTGYAVMHNFAGGTADGSYPYGGVTVQGSDIWGMTSNGGIKGNGTIFHMNTDGTGYSVMHSFDTGGRNPYGNLIYDAGLLYGMTRTGGSAGYGTVFAIDAFSPAGLSWFYKFTLANGPVRPFGSLMLYNSMLYGMTADGGGASNYGTMFKITLDGVTMNVLHNFTGGAGGQDPYGGLVTDGTYLYGMTYNGGANTLGMVFRTMLDGSVLVPLRDFAGAADGSRPYGSLLMYGGLFYGMTYAGGTHGRGVAFNINSDGTVFNLLHHFGPPTMTEGHTPGGGVVYDGTYLYGTTKNGGDMNYGTVYRIKSDGSGYSLVHEFQGALADGQSPWATPLLVGGTLYGTTVNGGSSGKGVVYKVNTNGSGYTVMDHFVNTNGANPYGGLANGGDGYLYGMTCYGGSKGWGTIFKVDIATGIISLIHSFDDIEGSQPWGKLLVNGTLLYGMTYQGGANDAGLIFKINTNGAGFAPMFHFDWTDGYWPYGSLVMDDTFLYGITNTGGGGDANECGTVFKLRKLDETYTVMRRLVTADGANSRGSLMLDGDFLYGMTNYLGANDYGTLFQVNKYTGALNVMHDFTGGPLDGAYPYYNDVIALQNPSLASTGNLIYHNNFISNTWQAEDNSGPTSWDNGLPDGGNHWDNYTTSVDANSDGIWDLGFVISGTASESDAYPWVRENGWKMPYTNFRSVAWDDVNQRFWICGDYSTNARSSVYYIPISTPSTMVPVSAPASSFSALAVDELGNVLVGGNDLQYIYYYETSTDNGYEIGENGTGAMWDWNITSITFNSYDNRFYFVGNVKNTDTGVAFFTESLPLNATGKKCFIDNSDFMNFPGIGGLRSISWNPVRNYSLAVGDGVYRLNPYTGTDQKLSWSTIEGPEAGKSYYDISWDTDGWNEAGIVGQNGIYGNYWRYYHTNPQLLNGNTSDTASVYPTCAMKPPSSPKWLLISNSDGAIQVNIQAKDESGEITLSFDLPHIFTVEMWKQNDVTKASVLNTQVDADTNYTFFIEGNYTSSGVDLWNDLYINITAWYDEGKAGTNSNPEPNWNTEYNRTRQFNITYYAGTASYSMHYPAPSGSPPEFYIAGLWLDPNTYGSDNSHHRLYINVSFGAQTYVAASDFSGGPASNPWDANLALNDVDSWDLKVNASISSGVYNNSFAEFGIKEYASVSVSGTPGGSAPPGTVNYTMATPSQISYSTNSQYYMNVSIPHLYLNGDSASPYFIPATDVQVQNTHSRATSSNSDAFSQIAFAGSNNGICIWGTESPVAPIAPVYNGTESAGPGYSDFTADSMSMAFEVTEVYWWVSIPAGLPEGTYRATITLTVEN
ncbi:MAG: right-handed parallel beta-helix repeat-containing protein [Candidatus Thermoplasmatota archaeon]|nr:hypothetical protein [Euryarchaeota archaeon]MBU4032088.1 right-handed parallel beta-helix repeat-containing protein [Candidatus Thermoplasmatota archaeon]MBU4071896.1 right-handed parallel beta-helix repeat-containing protein [Candidatus Thermoplasmatota archaeon]MBU4143800.1 right-handed parallel beta-helix repeat-containing protein [Candidatus Thermoplasmatota archaeon]MBU4591366.1 right-handed parallel beta-helix repeat-containing protein [Candidatus Thermoplasmatota archaeon]